MKTALWQTAPDSDVEACLTRLAAVVAEAAAASADLFVSPEMFIGGYNIGAATVSKNADIYDAVHKELCDLATTHQIALVVGLPTPNTGLPFNTCITIDKTGVERALYHKTHLFGDVDHAQFSAGETLSPVFDLGGWRIGLAICYDIEFPEVARDLALRGADLIVTPTANMEPFDSVATRIVPARAEENAVYVAYCNYLGTEGAFDYNGLSCICGPDGDDLVRADKNSTGLFYATLTRDTLQASRRQQSHLRDRRPSLYGKPT
ncbi:carbon-nitrogen hydrolase family protein [Sulfitobacter sp.]|uniref:carbon-nitrogen hydrolase family protein n=1 Tax=Sulfitobacter sp. TaxID=1903071 RepID=UPI003002D39D